MPRRAPGRSVQEQEALLAERERQVAELRRERDEARAQQDATAAVLRAMRTQAADDEAVLGTIAASAGRLCRGATGAVIWLVDGPALRVAGRWRGPAGAIGVGEAGPLDRWETTAGRAVL